MIARVRLERLRDSSPVYSAGWRMFFGWWSDPFDEEPGKITTAAASRMLNFKSDERQLIVADDGSGGWDQYRRRGGFGRPRVGPLFGAGDTWAAGPRHRRQRTANRRLVDG